MYSEEKIKSVRGLRGSVTCIIGSGAVFLCAMLLAIGCSTSKKLTSLKSGDSSNMLFLSKNDGNFVPEVNNQNLRDTIQVRDLYGRQVLVMKAVKDNSTGEMVATDVLDAAVVTAKFRNVAERHGKVDIAFLVKIPSTMQDSKWQLRLQPDMYIMGDTLKLDGILITGNEYRKAQLRGYELYERFVNKIITDTTLFINKRQLEYFLQRNLPELYALKDSEEEFSEERYQSLYGVSEQQAIEHYTYVLAKRRNERRKMKKGEKFRQYVKAPIVSEGIKLDSVMVDSQGDFVYNYVQTINVRPKLRKVEVALSGDIFEQDEKLYTIPKGDPLTFYISSVSAFVDRTEHYKTRVISRRVEANAEYSLNFEQGKSVIRPELNDNAKEIRSIKSHLTALIANEDFDLDSITVAATASPEGRYPVNSTLAQKRSEAACSYFSRFASEYSDSLKREEGFSISVDQTYRGKERKQQQIQFKAHCIPENWEDLDWYVENDAVLTPQQKQEFADSKFVADPDAREATLKKSAWYKYVADEIYPKLRTVKFNFYLHRKGMVKDTVHTTELDKTYMKGVQALVEMDYEKALPYLAPYQDFNTAIAYIGLDRNKSALQILQNEEKTARTEYLMAILYSRLNNPQAAIEHYMTSCRMNPDYIHRGNLDPEISALIKQYELYKLLDPETY